MIFRTGHKITVRLSGIGFFEPYTRGDFTIKYGEPMIGHHELVLGDGEASRIYPRASVAKRMFNVLRGLVHEREEQGSDQGTQAASQG